MKEKILVVEDDAEIAEVIKEYLEMDKYEVIWASTGKEGIDEFYREKFDLLLVDIMMPEMDGFTVCKNIRLKSEVPLLIISAKHGDLDKVKGLELGADDYLTKPFSLVELKARVESHLRRYRRYKNAEIDEDVLEYKGGLRVYKDKKDLEVEGEKVRLTSKEWELLMLMIGNPNRAFTKKEIYENVWNEKDINGNNTVTVHVKDIREKLGDSIKNPKYIETVWGIGYRFIGEKIV
ncbi:response regulator transcription factor [Clostridium sp. MB40-C1]|uniref:response regulator transcription factor n=1 Tax=Clostridium sp. MB40-C1 TaxID=3070996 RepID=UPI0027DF36A9|nr:response regulator transcription factor [Clostridium sp. MB40-C1]WMJ80941.1 response regulator transcription factor [Clostridium sp. MB40-C1]